MTLGVGNAAWIPDEYARSRAQLTRFMSACGCGSWDELYGRSITDVAGFTSELLRFLDIRFQKPFNRILDSSRGPAWPRWCVDGILNITESCVDKHQATSTRAQAAIVWEGEEDISGQNDRGATGTRRMTYAELFVETETCAAGLRACGLGKGDAVGLHLPMLPETVVALLAIGRIGGIAVPLFSGYGSTAIASRLRDVEAKAVFTCDGFPRRGKAVPAKSVLDEALKDCPSIKRVFIVPRLGGNIRVTEASDAGIRADGVPDSQRTKQVDRDMTWQGLLALGASAPAASRRPEATSAEDPLLILYTSGTTGRPKGIVHSHCGFPVKAAQDMAFGTDLGPGDRITWVTDIGWMMGPWLIYGSLLLGATMVLYDGAPDFPAPDRLWDFCARNRVGILGISPSLIRSLATRGDDLPRRHDLSALRILASTGEPWNPDPWWWLFDKVGGKRLPIINYSGGTEISGGILMGNPLLPIEPCSFSAPCLGIDADVVDEAGQSLRGKVGELVIRKPWIGMARGFWKDPERYLETYWSRWPGLWVHGDWAMVEAGQWTISGRSDDTLKVAGKRVGPAEVESILVGHPSVIEAAVVGVPDAMKGTALVAFCVVADGVTGKLPKATEPESTETGLAEALEDRVAIELGKPLRPDKVFFVPALPRTRNAKVMRRVIRAAYLGEDPGDVTALENPASLDAIRKAGVT